MGAGKGKAEKGERGKAFSFDHKFSQVFGSFASCECCIGFSKAFSFGLCRESQSLPPPSTRMELV